MGASESAERLCLKCNCVLNFVTSKGNLADYVSFNPLVRENKALRKDTVSWHQLVIKLWLESSYSESQVFFH